MRVIDIYESLSFLVNPHFGHDQIFATIYQCHRKQINPIITPSHLTEIIKFYTKSLEFSHHSTQFHGLFSGAFSHLEYSPYFSAKLFKSFAYNEYSFFPSLSWVKLVWKQSRQSQHGVSIQARYFAWHSQLLCSAVSFNFQLSSWVNFQHPISTPHPNETHFHLLPVYEGRAVAHSVGRSMVTLPENGNGIEIINFPVIYDYPAC